MKELFDAIRAGDSGRVSALLDADPSLAGARDDSGVPALAAARYNGKSDIAQLLLERGAPLDVFVAAMFGNVDRLRDLIAVDPQAVKTHSSDGWTALHLAAFFDQPDAARALIDAGADVNARSTNQMSNTALHAAAAGRATTVARMLLESGASANARQHGGWTALHSAAQSGNAELARILIAAGADIGVRAENQQSPMDLALTSGHQEMAELLETFEAGR
jgi:ankyrin repeat protein